MRTPPLQQINKTLSSQIPEELHQFLPKKWEKLGDILILILPVELHPYEQLIGNAYGSILHCSTVLVDEGGITGRHRKPQTRVIYGDTNTETIHKENQVLFNLDPQQVMFSSGNMDERKRMADIAHHDEVVVDLFAGIGYFSLPMAIHSKPQKIFACEINPAAYKYLKQNITLNKVDGIVKPILGDNRDTAPKGIANRVIMGYFEETQLFLPTAITCLQNNGGIIHYHDIVAKEQVKTYPDAIIQPVLNRYKTTGDLLHVQKVKSFAPHIQHIVYDLEVKPVK